MIVSSVEKMAYDIGKDIGCLDNETQGRLLNGFAHSISQIHSLNKAEMQLCYISDELTNEAKQVICNLAEFCKEEK